MSRTPQVVGQIDEILASIEQQKTAAARTEPGSIGGATTHPSKDVDDRTSPAREGFRSKENEDDVGEMEGPAGVNRTAPIKGGTGSQDSVQYNIGTEAKPTGEAPSVETGSAKGTKEDGGTIDGKTTHPARTDNGELDGGKYANVSQAISVLRERTKQARDTGNEILGILAASATDPAPSQTPAKTAAAAPQKPAEEAQLGHDFAGVFTDQLDKQALDELVVDAYAKTYARAEKQAEMAVSYLDNMFATLAKKGGEGEGDEEPAGPPAEETEEPGLGGAPGDEGSEPAAPSPMDEGAGGLGGAPEAGGLGGAPEGGAGGGQIDIKQLEALIQLLLAQTQGGGAGGPPGAGAGGPPMGGGAGGGLEAALAGGPAMGAEGAAAGMAGGAGGPPPGAEGGMPPGAEGGGGEDLGPLEHVLHQAGVTADELEAASSAKLASMLSKKAAAKPAKKTGWQPKNAAEQKWADDMTNYVRELVGRSRR